MEIPYLPRLPPTLRTSGEAFDECDDCKGSPARVGNMLTTTGVDMYCQPCAYGRGYRAFCEHAGWWLDDVASDACNCSEPENHTNICN